MRDPKTYQFDLPPLQRPVGALLSERIHAAGWRIAPTVTSDRPGDPLLAVQAIVIHATAGHTTDGAVSVMQGGRESFHWIVPAEREAAHGAFVWATAPERRAAWHVRHNCAHKDVCGGSTGLNQLSLGVEIVNAQSGGDQFSDWQLSATAQIVRYAWAKYPNLRHVVSHAKLDPARRSDPGRNFPWETLKAQTLNHSCGQ